MVENQYQKPQDMENQPEKYFLNYNQERNQYKQINLQDSDTGKYIFHKVVISTENELSTRQKWLNLYNSFKALCCISAKSKRLLSRIFLIIAVLFLVGLLHLRNQSAVESKMRADAQEKGREEEIRREKEKKPELKCQTKVKSNLFYVNVDLETLTQQQKIQFDEQNKICGPYSNQDILALRSNIEIWNQHQSSIMGNNDFIENKENYSPEEQRLLMIFLHIYLNGSSYLHPKQQLQQIQDRCLDPIYYGNELIFNKIDHYNETTKIYVPSINSTLLKVARRYNWMIRKMIKSIVNHEDYMSICNNYQCAIMECDKKKQIINQSIKSMTSII